MEYKSQITFEYSPIMFDYLRDIKTDFCWAVDTKNLELLEQAYTAAKKQIGGDKRGRPRLPYQMKAVRRRAEADACLILSNAHGMSYTKCWRTFFPDNRPPRKPTNNVHHCKISLQFHLEKYGPDLRRHLTKLGLTLPDGAKLVDFITTEKK